jgi:AMMECR1 domain-containing protein
VLLPQVPVEQGWDRETFLHHVCLKAGLPTSAWRDPDIALEAFSAEVFGDDRPVGTGA